MTKKVKLILVAITFIILLPISTKAVTLGEYEQIVDKYKKEIASIQNNIAKKEEEIKAAQKEVETLKEETVSLLEEVTKIDKEIINANQEIKEKSLQIKQLFEYLQLSSGENTYMEYIFGAETVTDLIYRTAVIEQITEYNDDIIKELEDLIEANKKREDEIEKRKIEITKKQEQLEKKIVTLGEEKSSLGDTGVTSKQQLKIYEDLVSSYKEQGCKSSDVIGVDCANNGSAGVFRRPVEKGYITSEFGSRWGSFHRAIDISNNDPYNTKIYPVANGTIVAKFIDYYGALIVMITHYDAVNNQYYTSLYAHMSSFAPNIYVGKYVTSDDYIGYMGDTGYSFGAHLHLEIAPCRYLIDSVCSNWTNYTNFMYNQYKDNGYKGPRQLINFPSGTYNYWYSR